MSYERTKIKICNKCVLTFLIPSASFLQLSWISTVTLYLHITSRVFPSTHYRPVQGTACRDVSDAEISRSADADADANIRTRRSSDANADAKIWNIINATSY